jgi:hypothetical protein
LFAVLRDDDECVLEILRAEREGDDIAWGPEGPSDIREEMMNASQGDSKDINARAGVIILPPPKRHPNP